MVAWKAHALGALLLLLALTSLCNGVEGARGLMACKGSQPSHYFHYHMVSFEKEGMVTMQGTMDSFLSEVSCRPIKLDFYIFLLEVDRSSCNCLLNIDQTSMREGDNYLFLTPYPLGWTSTLARPPFPVSLPPSFSLYLHRLLKFLSLLSVSLAHTFECHTHAHPAGISKFKYLSNVRFDQTQGLVL